MSDAFDVSVLPFAALMGLEITHAAPDRVEGRLVVRPDLCTAGAILHGGAAMALADSLGAVGAFLSTPAGMRTTTLESKTNFIGSAKAGSTVTATATPLHIGRRQLGADRQAAAEQQYDENSDSEFHAGRQVIYQDGRARRMRNTRA